ncbi:hypothetical protein BCR33DRAFT_817566 [Rhizoclosmatium globosum]|uniref:Protein kinase domain-containing protein n=1 Tax=Rhizoclosmatium globosum TaxID=329046 RepID=A0A1Y2CBP3_9FUNG|nr:hypothetical protein BCR33DRAFT_817566 [Rhizoclosmatium globosum]|eukprot:ORY44453.1 hypothetical protein BCR33DRAFT_817566 [Rhizoclosmatium globosum]
MGSPFWMPPEIIQLEGAMKSSDIWSVGCTVSNCWRENHLTIHLIPCPSSSISFRMSILHSQPPRYQRYEDFFGLSWLIRLRFNNTGIT